MTGNNEVLEEYISRNRKRRNFFLFSLLFLFLFSLYALTVGSYDLSILDIIKLIIHKDSSLATERLVVFQLRLPRILAAIIAGAGLSVSGCIMQNNLNNPLASPSTLGIAPAAIFGANFAIIFLGAGSLSSGLSSTVSINNPYIVTLSAFAFSMLTVLLILSISKKKNFNPSFIVLAGVALSSLYTALTTVLQYFADEDQITKAVFWTFGDLSRIDYFELVFLSVIVILSILYFFIKHSDYNTLAVGDDVAKSLGVNASKTRLIGLLLSSLITAVSVSFLGMIAFVGLLGPHIMRKVVGHNHLFLIPASALLGSILLLSSDLIARSIIAPVVLPVGAITSLLGGIVFLMILFGKDGIL